MKQKNNSPKCSLLFIFLFAVVFMGLCSCELFMEAKHGKPTFSKVNILVYGNDYYYGARYKGTYGSPLKCTINDVTQVGLALESWADKAGIKWESLYVTGKDYTKKGSSETIPYVPENRSDHNTTKSHFRTLMEELAERSNDGELTFIFFSCHGYNTSPTGVVQDYGKERNTGFVMCGNFSNTEQCEIYWHNEFKEDLAKINGAKVVFADVCFSGGIVDSGNVSINTAEYNGMTANQLFLEDNIYELSDTFSLAASRYYELSWESSSFEHGNFTKSLLSALCWDENNQCLNGNSEGKLTFLELCQQVVSDVPKYNSSQHPMLSGGSNDLILFEV